MTFSMLLTCVTFVYLSFLANVEPAGDQRLRFYRTVRLRVRLYGLYALT